MPHESRHIAVSRYLLTCISEISITTLGSGGFAATRHQDKEASRPTSGSAGKLVERITWKIGIISRNQAVKTMCNDLHTTLCD